MMFVIAHRPGVTYSDDFNRANGGLGSNWTTLTNAPVIASNVAQAGTTGPSNTFTVYGARWVDPVLTNNQEVSCTVHTPPAPSTPTLGSGLVLHCDSSGNRVEAVIASDAVYFFTRISGTGTQRASQTVTVNSGTAIRATAVGNVYSIYLAGSGTATLTWTDSGNLVGSGSSNRYLGLITLSQKNIGGSISGYGYNIDNWVGKDL